MKQSEVISIAEVFDVLIQTGMSLVKTRRFIVKPKGTIEGPHSIYVVDEQGNLIEALSDHTKEECLAIVRSIFVYSWGSVDFSDAEEVLKLIESGDKEESPLPNGTF